ncbi:hypothetical protein RM530_16835 [Algiphilus sp. W345]|uniref:Uncharacterized protein n=1 Tax=Banduia mediterranea TaxID=3075609 RepID=A0ABU2WMA8_9GAMM|nr:hypothetical protein [Algiphilus sp. W345]MDT0499010.1 hypothetical protein [Algiphilus sp. W345]
MPTDAAIETQGLLKHFGSTRAVDGIALQVQRGSSYGVLGANGAGRTTAVRMQATPLLIRLAAANIEASGFSLGQPSLDEVFFALTGQPATAEDNDVSEPA